ncbi:MAG TPA: beta-propeller domain-containing protein [Bacillota bacterium]|nr:beta-propeller domain-containing protein [Bacillota bacterium]
MKSRRRHPIFNSLLLLLTVCLLLNSGIIPTYPLQQSIVQAAENLPLVATEEKLTELLSPFQDSISYDYGGYAIPRLFNSIKGYAGAVAESAAPQTQDTIQAPSEKQTTDSGNYSTTNLQVEGVDEADTVKTDGNYLYYLSGQKITIVRAKPAEAMQVVGEIEISPEDNALEFFINGDRLVLITQTYKAWDLFESSLKPAENGNSDSDLTVTHLYNIADRTNPLLLRKLTQEGNYLSARAVGSVYYVITNHSIYGCSATDLSKTLPRYTDTLFGNETQRVRCDELYYMPEFTIPNYLMTMVFDINQEEPAKINTYLGAGENIFATAAHLYIASGGRSYGVMEKSVNKSNSPLMRDMIWSGQSYTRIYKFALEDDNLIFVADGEVTGCIINRYAMGEGSDGSFRIATTGFTEGSYETVNLLFTLDEDMQPLGALRDLAKGEKIYSVRFMSDRAFIVTFKTVDPLFVIDLTDSAQPVVLGELKIPGYSDYLHPWGDNYLIGFGKDTVTLPVKSGSGVVLGEQAYYLGMKLSLFDISDLSQPVEVDVALIGDRGTDSPLLSDAKALLFQPATGLLAFPVWESTIAGAKISEYGYPNYGEMTRQGLFVFSVTEEGFTYRDCLSHHEFGETAFWEDQVERAVSIGETIYTFSPAMIQAHYLQDLTQIAKIDLK